MEEEKDLRLSNWKNVSGGRHRPVQTEPYPHRSGVQGRLKLLLLLLLILLQLLLQQKTLLQPQSGSSKCIFLWTSRRPVIKSSVINSICFFQPKFQINSLFFVKSQIQLCTRGFESSIGDCTFTFKRCNNLDCLTTWIA